MVNNYKEQLYRFIDNTGHCFIDFAKIPDTIFNHKTIAALLVGSNKGWKYFTLSEMLCYRDVLFEAGFKWGKDFYVRKV